MGVDTFMTVDMQYVYQDKLLDGYSAMQYGAGYFDHSDITVNSYLFADGSMDKKLANLISPYYVGKVTDAVTKAASRYQLNGINLGTASWFLYSDYLENRIRTGRRLPCFMKRALPPYRRRCRRPWGTTAMRTASPMWIT